MSTSVVVEGHSISSTAVLQEMIATWQPKLPYTTEQNRNPNSNNKKIKFNMDPTYEQFDLRTGSVS